MKKIIMFVTSLWLASCASQTQSTSNNTSWSSGMRSMAQNIEQLTPYIFSAKDFNDAANHDKVHKMIADFDANIKKVPQHDGSTMLGKDPIVQYSFSRLKMNTDLALQSFEQGANEFSRNTLQRNVSLCFNCHTTQNFGPQNSFSFTTIGNNFRITPSEQAEFYVATRQFDKALNSLEEIIKSPTNLITDPHEQYNALKKYLILQVRVKNDPAPAIDVVKSYLSFKNLPYFISVDAKAWLDSLVAWKNEAANHHNYYSRAKNLLREADAMRLKGYQSGLVNYLRASTILHEELLVTKDKKKQAAIYRLLGDSYAAISDVGFWQLPEVYYEACIRNSPKSNEAKNCYKAYERTVVLGFAGSSGINIPEQERKILSELKELSGLKTSNASQKK